MNRHEFQKQKHLKNDMKKRFDDNTEFAKEFTDNKSNYYDNENFSSSLNNDENKNEKDN